jgi:hypothetical protein
MDMTQRTIARPAAVKRPTRRQKLTSWRERRPLSCRRPRRRERRLWRRGCRSGGHRRPGGGGGQRPAAAAPAAGVGGDRFLHDFGNRLDTRYDGLALEIEKFNAGDSLEFTELDGLADLQLRDVHLNGGGQILREAADADLIVRRDFQHAALVLDAKGFAHDLDRHADFHLLVGLHFLKIDVQVFVGQRIALNFLKEGQGLFSLVLALQLNEDGATGNRLQQAGEFRGPSTASFSGWYASRKEWRECCWPCAGGGRRCGPSGRA